MPVLQGHETPGRVVVAVIMTSHNRRSLTVESIRCVLEQRIDARVAVRVYLTDDASADGTAEAVAAMDKRISVISGSGFLFWAAGMARSEAVASSDGFDFLLWLNDDTFLFPDALQLLLGVSEQNPDAVVVGAAIAPGTDTAVYGARRRLSKWHPQRFELLPLASEVQEADTFNGNIVLIPRTVHDRVGAIDGAFPHAYADDDYGLRARAAGLAVLQAPGAAGECTPNPQCAPIRGWAAWRDAQTTKGLPLRAQIRFFRRHGGVLWPVTLFAQQILMLAPLPHALRDEYRHSGE